MSAQLSAAPRAGAAPRQTPARVGWLRRSRLAKRGYFWLLDRHPDDAVLLFPLYWMAVTSVTAIGDLLSAAPPDHPGAQPPAAGQLQRHLPYLRRRQLAGELRGDHRRHGRPVAGGRRSGRDTALSRMGSRGATTAGLLMLVTRVIPGTLLVMPFFVVF